MGQITCAVILLVKHWLHKMSNQLKLTEFLKKRTRDERDNPSEDCLTEEYDTLLEQSVPDSKP